MDRWFDGSIDRWFDGSLVRWIAGSMDRWSLLDVQNIRWFVFCSRTKMAFAFQLFHVSLFLVFLTIHSPVVNPSNIPKTWLDFVQSCIASFKSSGAKHYFSNVFYPSGGDHVGGPEAYRIPPVILWNPLIQTECDLACPYCQSSLRTWRWNDGTSPHSVRRSIFSIQERVLLVSCVYLCENHHQVIAHDPELLKLVREAGIRIPFILLHKPGMTKELHDFISISIQAGLCSQDIENMLLNMYSCHHSNRTYLYYSQRTCSIGGNVQCNLPLFNPKKDSIWCTNPSCRSSSKRVKLFES